MLRDYLSAFQTGPDRYQAATLVNKADGSVDQRKLALIVGFVAIALPLIPLVLSQAFDYICQRNSLSHYYYDPFLGPFFVGSLVFIAAFLWVYKGEDQDGAEDRLASLAALPALGVAFFPTSGTGCENQSKWSRAFAEFTTHSDNTIAPPKSATDTLQHFQLFAGAEILHYLSAGILFFILAWFAFFVFTAVDEDQVKPNGRLKSDKIYRNALYYLSGTVILLVLAALLVSYFAPSVLPLTSTEWDARDVTFWLEAAALLAFGISWIVKGRLWKRTRAMLR